MEAVLVPGPAAKYKPEAGTKKLHVLGWDLDFGNIFLFLFGNIFFVSNSSEPQCIEALLLSVFVLCFQSILSSIPWPAGSAAAAGLGPKFVASVKIPGRPPIRVFRTLRRRDQSVDS